MAVIDELKALFERDVRFATWDENVKVDESDPNNIDVRFYTDTNEYMLTISILADGDHNLDLSVRPRKARAGQAPGKPRRILPTAHHRLDARTWRRMIGNIVGLELVRVQKRDPMDPANETQKEPLAGAAATKARTAG
jgi:hypothetical protein